MFDPLTPPQGLRVSDMTERPVIVSGRQRVSPIVSLIRFGLSVDQRDGLLSFKFSVVLDCIDS